MLLVRSVVLQHVPRKTAHELSVGFGVVLATLVVATLVIGLAVAARVLDATAGK